MTEAVACRLMPSDEFRPLTVDDAHAVLEIVNASYRADGVEMVLSPEEADEMLTATHFTPATDGLAVTSGGRMVAYGLARLIPSDAREIRVFLDGAVHPDHRRRGIGTELVRRTTARARELLVDGRPDLPRFIRAFHFDWLEDRRALFSSFGFAPIRYFDEMLRDLRESPEPATDGFTIVPWDLARTEEIRTVKNTAFQDHWGSTPTDVETWTEWMDEYGVRLDLSHLAIADDTIIGYSLNATYPADEAVHGRREGWIQNLGTLPAWRGRGVASALLARSMRTFLDAGLTHAAIGVDSASPTGAHRLYAAVGFERVRREILVQIEVRPGQSEAPTPDQN